MGSVPVAGLTIEQVDQVVADGLRAHGTWSVIPASALGGSPIDRCSYSAKSRGQASCFPSYAEMIRTAGRRREASARSDPAGFPRRTRGRHQGLHAELL